MVQTSEHRSSRLPAIRNVTILVAAQALMGAQLPMIFTVAGLAGTSIASNPCLATLPISLLVLGSMLSATPLSGIMQKYGRRTGFLIGAMAGAIGASISAWGLIEGSFVLFCAGSLLSGTYMSSQGFFRFAAADTVAPDMQAKAISWVLAGGLISAILGPQLGKTVALWSVVPFLGTYVAVIALNVIGATLYFGLRIPPPQSTTAENADARSRWQLLKSPPILVAIICAMVSYSLMNLVMTSTPLAVVGCGFTQGNAFDIVMAHVIAMFAPSFVTGHLINRFGVEKIMATGLCILASAGIVALSGVTLANFFGALILLGVGWNFGFIGATTLLGRSHSKAEQGRVQGMNDMLVFGMVTVASLSSGALMGGGFTNCDASDAVAGWNAVNFAMVPFLVLAGGALVWLVLQNRRPGQAAA
ncbi:MAG: MFS transporter [Pseudomonadota bacterium]